MNNIRAVEILTHMANGIDPTTGEILSDDHFCNSSEVIRALYHAINALTCTLSSSSLSITSKKINAGRSWTAEDNIVLERLFNEGYSINHICKHLQRRERGVLKQLKLLGLITVQSNAEAETKTFERNGKRWTPEENAMLTDLYIDKWSIPEISTEMQRSCYAIYCHMEKLGLYGAEYGYPEESPVKWTKEKIQELQMLYESGNTIEELSEYFNCSERNVSARLFYMGLIKTSPLSVPIKK